MAKAERERGGAGKSDFMAKARERYQRAKDYWDEIYAPCKEDMRFYGGEQWPEAVKNMREVPGQNARPCLTINRLPQFHNQIVNDYRQASYSMKAAPQETEDESVAEIYQGLFRQIEKQSNAQIAYVKALSDGTIGGIGYLRVITDYANEKSFDQDIFIKRFKNPFVNYPDPAAEEYFFEDAEYWFVMDIIAKDSDEYDMYYGEDGEFDVNDFPADDTMSYWRKEEGVTVVEYFYFKRKKRVLLEYMDGTTGFLDEVPEEALESEAFLGSVRRRRNVEAKELHWAKIDGANILEETVWAKPRIPIVPVFGTELWVGDKRVLKGITRDAMDSCRMYNYWQSAKAEMIALAPKAPYIAAAGQLEGYTDDWQNASTTPKSVLYYKPVSVDGHLVPAPQRQVYEAPVQSIIQASLQSADDIKASIGMYDASIGAKSNEVSGKAIRERKAEGETATFNYTDNLALSLGYMATIVAELIPVIYDTQRIVRIVGKEGDVKRLEINGEGQPNVVDIQYDLVLDTGPSFATKRQQTAETIIDLSHNFPQLMEVAGDIAVRNMDFADANEIAERLRRAMPPQLLEDDKNAVAKLTQAQEQLKELGAVVKELQDRLAEAEEELKGAKLEVKNKRGELKVKMGELMLKRVELAAKMKEMSPESAKAVSGGVEELRGMIEDLMDMILATVPQNATDADDGEEMPSDDVDEMPPEEEAAVEELPPGVEEAEEAGEGGEAPPVA